MLAYHFVGDTLRDGSAIPADGEKLVFDDEPILCRQGLHASIEPYDALQYAPGNTLCLVELSGKIVYGEDKVVATERTIIKQINAESLMQEFARNQALSVAHLWDMPEVVRQYLETGDESLKDAAARAAAYAAARAAAYAAARAAARAVAHAADAAAYAADAAADASRAAARAAARAADAAARAAAYAAARAAARKEFNEMVYSAFN
jgi:hypothetical protein